MPQDPALPPKDPALPPGAGKRKIKLKASPEDTTAKALQGVERAKLSSLAGREFDSPQSLARAFKSAKPGPDPTQPAPKMPMRRTDWADKTKQYAATLNDAYIMFKTAKTALTPPNPEEKLVIHGRKKRPASKDPDDHRFEFYGDRAPLTKTFYGKTKEGVPGAEYKREVASLELPGMSVDEKLAKLGKTAAEAQADLESADKTLSDVANSYQNDIHKLLEPLEAKRDELEARLEKASGGRVATGRGQSDLPAPAPKEVPAAAPAATPTGDPALPPKSTLPPRPTFSTVDDRTPTLDRSMSTSRISSELYNINNRIVRGYKTIETIQKIVSNEDRSLFTKRWDPDPEVARFIALLYLIANRDLAGMYVDNGMDWVANAKGQGRWVPRSSSKMGVLRGPGDKYYEGDELKSVPKVPERPPTDVPPTEAIQRFVQILEGESAKPLPAGSLKALRYLIANRDLAGMHLDDGQDWVKALRYLIANRDLAGMHLDDGQDWVVNPKTGAGRLVPRSSGKRSVLRGRGDKYYEGDELKGRPDVPERPPTDVPPTEAIQRFVQILEGVGLEAALKHALLTGTPLCESAKLLTAGYLKLKGFEGNESFLNGRYCHLVSAKDDHLIVKVLDEDVHRDDRIFRISFDEATLIDGAI